MKEYRISDEGLRDINRKRIRFLYIFTLGLFLFFSIPSIVFVIVTHTTIMEDIKLLTILLFAFLLLTSAMLLLFLFMNRSQQKKEKTFRILLGDDFIKRSQQSLPDIEIKFDQIESIKETPIVFGYPHVAIIIQASNKYKNIFIISYIDGYQEIRSKLSQWKSIQVEKKINYWIFVWIFCVGLFLTIPLLYGYLFEMPNTLLLKLYYISSFTFSLWGCSDTLQFRHIGRFTKILVNIVYASFLIALFYWPPIGHEEKVTYSLIAFFLFFILYFIMSNYRLSKSFQTVKQAQQQLIKAEKMAALGKLVAGVAHEINNPINFIKSNILPLKDYIKGFKNVCQGLIHRKNRMPQDLQAEFEEILEREDIDYAMEDCEKLLQSFDEGSERIARIVRDLRQYSRADGEYAGSCDIIDLLEASLHSLETLFGERITLHKEYRPIPRLACAPGQIKQAFENILRNAADFIEGKGNVWIFAHQDGKDAVIKIQDDGIGIPRENLSKAFDPFFTTKPIGAGTGLGLSLAQGIVEHHNGKILIESEEGKGTAFTVILPIIPT